MNLRDCPILRLYECAFLLLLHIPSLLQKTLCRFSRLDQRAERFLLAARYLQQMFVS